MNDKIEFCGLGHINIVVDDIDEGISFYSTVLQAVPYQIFRNFKNTGFSKVSAKYCYAAHESRLHQNDRCKRFTLCLVLTVRFRSLAPWGKLFQLFI